MQALRTYTAWNPAPWKMTHGDKILLAGSCFAGHMAGYLQERGWRTSQPFGPLFNPASIAAALHRLIEDREITVDDLVQHEGLWHSWHHHGSFSRPTAEETLALCNSRIHQAHKRLKEATLLMVTFGTAWIFERRTESGERRVVANCHKLPPQEFVRRRMTVEEIVALWQPLLDILQAYYPTLNLLLSVSPIRHLADGAHGNQLSKSTLLLAIDQLLATGRWPLATYFPAYEIVLDELRDYRYFDEKMTHPTPLAVDVVWERFQNATMSPAVRQQAHYNMKQHKREKHIPLH